MNNPKVLQVLTQAHQLLSDPTKWTTGVTARDQDGNQVDSTDPTARQWCVYGAIYMISGIGDWRTADAATDTLQIASQQLGLSDLVGTHVNDGPNGHANILRVLTQAIQLQTPATEN
jgi:hypothetical protein